MKKNTHVEGFRAPVQRRFFLILAGAVLATALPAIARAEETKPPAPREAPVERPPSNARQPVRDTAPLPAKGDARVGAVAPERARVEYDDHAEVGLWARGASYKAGFQREGTTYAPFLGSQAPRSYPVVFRLAHASVGGTPIEFDAEAGPQLEGDVVRYERGSVTEVYELALESVEQRFVFDSLPGEGDLVLRIAAETELEGRETPERIEFANELGTVRYGRATALDAEQRSVAAVTRLTEEGIEIRVPAGFVAAARFPLVIDPIVSTFSIDTSFTDSFFADVAARWTSGGAMTVYEEIFSAVDRDVRYRLLNASGASITTGYIDASLTQNWMNPAVALGNYELGERFLVVAEVGFAPNRVIQGRMVSPSGPVTTPGFVISTSDMGGDKLNPDVGGDPFSGGGSYLCVVWERVFSASDRDIHYRLVHPSGSLQGTSTRIVDNSGSTVDTLPSISKSNDTSTWNVAWQRAGAGSPSQQDLHAARILWNGAILAPSFPVESGITDTGRPAASSSLDGTDRWVIAYERNDSGADFDIGLYALNGPFVTDSVLLTGLEANALSLPTLSENQVRPDVDSDGKSFAVAYAESYEGSSTDYDIYVSTVALTGERLNLSEGHLNLAFSSTAEDHVAISALAASTSASMGGGTSGPAPWRRHFVVWEDLVDPAVHANIEGGLYDASSFTSFCLPGQSSASACPCGNPPSAYGRGCDNSAGTGGALLSASGQSDLGGPLFPMVLTASFEPATALTIFNQGTAVLDTSVAFGQGLRCVGGNILRLYTKSAVGGAASAPGPGDPNIDVRSAQLGDVIAGGTTRSYYVYYRDGFVLGGCPAASTFNTTQSIQALWIP